MKYITTLEASENWKISERMTRKYCIQGCIPGAIQKDKTWLIPEDAQKPSRVAVPDEPEPLPPLALKLIRQKKKKNYHGLYDYVQINLRFVKLNMIQYLERRFVGNVREVVISWTLLMF